MPFPSTLPQPSKPLILTTVVLIILLGILGGGAYTLGHSYQGRVAPNVSIGTLAVGGMKKEQAMQAVQARVDAILAKGVEVSSEGEQATLPLASDTTDYVTFDVEGVVEEAMRTGRMGNPFVDGFLLLPAILGAHTELVVPAHADLESLQNGLSTVLPNQEITPKETTFRFTQTGTTWQAEVVAGIPGKVFALENLFPQLEKDLAHLDPKTYVLHLKDTEPTVTLTDAEALREKAVEAITRAPYTVRYTPEDGSEERAWTLDAPAVAKLLIPWREVGLLVSVDPLAVDVYLDTIAPEIEVQAQNARFAVENGRVAEFTQSRAGIAINRQEMRTRFESAIVEGQNEVALSVSVTEPDVTTNEVNDLGINEVLGVGTSSFKGSPANRIKNIRNGVRLLNGRLIGPGETFSLLAALEPFDYANGYLPELVIKGDKIEPEIGGGLCQIGTTTFRAAMNSGLVIAERRNHSLVVSYYNDPSNGNPGTDATIYDPAPDFKFTNDTGHYILFQAEILEESQSLRFSFWGTPDGRKGSYTPPVVTRWIGTGEPVNKETTDLAPGELKCQSSHVGADTTFTYTVVRADGTQEDTVFESHYRPLPKICLVGVEQLSEPPPADGTTTPPAEEITPPTESPGTPVVEPTPTN